MDNRKIIGENAKRARKSSGFTQESIAEFLNVDQSLISKFEKGERGLQSDMLEKLANLYGYSIVDFESSDGVLESKIKIAYRSDGLAPNDIDTLHNIRRIALNLRFMSELAKGEQNEN